MNLEKIELKPEGYFSAGNEKNLTSFLDVCPVKVEEYLVAWVKVYPQDIYHNGELINTIPFYVVGLVPERSFQKVNIDLSGKVKMKRSISLHPDRYEFGMKSFPSIGEFYVRLYKVPAKPNLKPPQYFRKEIHDRGGDLI